MAEAFKPDLVGYGLSTGCEQRFFDINRELKERFGVFSLFGGAHPTFFPEMIEEPGVDAICLSQAQRNSFVSPMETPLKKRPDMVIASG